MTTRPSWWSIIRQLQITFPVLWKVDVSYSHLSEGRQQTHSTLSTWLFWIIKNCRTFASAMTTSALLGAVATGKGSVWASSNSRRPDSILRGCMSCVCSSMICWSFDKVCCCPIQKWNYHRLRIKCLQKLLLAATRCNADPAKWQRRKLGRPESSVWCQFVRLQTLLRFYWL